MSQKQLDLCYAYHMFQCSNPPKYWKFGISIGINVYGNKPLQPPLLLKITRVMR